LPIAHGAAAPWAFCGARFFLFLFGWSIARRDAEPDRVGADAWSATCTIKARGCRLQPERAFSRTSRISNLRPLSDLLNKCRAVAVYRSNDRLTVDFMKRFFLLLLAAIGLMALAPQPAKADVDFGVTFGVPGYYDPYPVYYGPYYGDRYYYYHHYRPYYYYHPYHYGYWHRGWRHHRAWD
jgi:hypothetical protein